MKGFLKFYIFIWVILLTVLAAGVFSPWLQFFPFSEFFLLIDDNLEWVIAAILFWYGVGVIAEHTLPE